MQPIKIGTLCIVVYAPAFPEYLGRLCKVTGIERPPDNYVTDLAPPADVPSSSRVCADRRCLRPLDDTLPPEPASHRRREPFPGRITINGVLVGNVKGISIGYKPPSRLPTIPALPGETAAQYRARVLGPPLGRFPL